MDWILLYRLCYDRASIKTSTIRKLSFDEKTVSEMLKV
ncbi:unnamed protein product [Musa acuminata subsp. malaccensis]|uniref:(wild Malaysian banana) hypothetical protein n=1 Tax=Musa acuminata subsp. malaccensis TaxID=214687 RepID=A0A804L6U5_MUSAM|nr:unnamed protein product [Musa acuminata subsp. malaccensis]